MHYKQKYSTKSNNFQQIKRLYKYMKENVSDFTYQSAIILPMIVYPKGTENGEMLCLQHKLYTLTHS